jgi:hypothetical protein
MSASTQPAQVEDVDTGKHATGYWEVSWFLCAGCGFRFGPIFLLGRCSSTIPTQACVPLISSAVWKAAAYGDFEALKRLEDANPGLIKQPDEQGYYAVQWAALNNRVAVLTYLADKGCDLNAADGTGQTALHWSAVRCALPALEMLLRLGADLNASDSRLGFCKGWYEWAAYLLMRFFMRSYIVFP